MSVPHMSGQIPVYKTSSTFRGMYITLHIIKLIIMGIGVIQQLSTWTEFCHFSTLPPCVDSFYTLSVDKNRHSLTPSPLNLNGPLPDRIASSHALKSTWVGYKGQILLHLTKLHGSHFPNKRT